MLPQHRSIWEGCKVRTWLPRTPSSLQTAQDGMPGYRVEGKITVRYILCRLVSYERRRITPNELLTARRTVQTSRWAYMGRKLITSRRRTSHFLAAESWKKTHRSPWPPTFKRASFEAAVQRNCDWMKLSRL